MAVPPALFRRPGNVMEFIASEIPPMLGALIFLTFGLAGDTSKPPAVTPDEFHAWFEASRTGKLELPASVSFRASRCRYVFVAGFSNERMPSYFSQNVRELRDRGVPANAIRLMQPTSRKTVEENAEEVRERFLEIASEGGEPLVIIGHSRGACDALAFALANPRFVRTHVRALFLVQGAFGGSSLADYVTGEAKPLDRRTPLPYRALANLASRAERRAVNSGRHAGLTGLTRQASQDFWERMLEEHADAIPVVSPKTFYVTTERSPARQRLFKRATGWYLQTYDGPNDGLVVLEDQSLPVLGTVLATLDAGHGDLTLRAPFSAPATRQLRRALMEAIIMAVGRTEEPQETRLTTPPRDRRDEPRPRRRR